MVAVVAAPLVVVVAVFVAVVVAVVVIVDVAWLERLLEMNKKPNEKIQITTEQQLFTEKKKQKRAEHTIQSRTAPMCFPFRC